MDNTQVTQLNNQQSSESISYNLRIGIYEAFKAGFFGAIGVMVATFIMGLVILIISVLMGGSLLTTLTSKTQQTENSRNR